MSASALTVRLPRPRRVDRLTWLSRGLSLTGLMIAGYLAVTYLQGEAPVCTISHGCAKVAASRYARPAGIPLPLFGIAGYLALLVSAWLPGQRARTAGMIFTVIAVSASAVLTYLELRVIHAVCIWCVCSAVCASLHVLVNGARYLRGDATLN